MEEARKNKQWKCPHYIEEEEEGKTHHIGYVIGTYIINYPFYPYRAKSYCQMQHALCNYQWIRCYAYNCFCLKKRKMLPTRIAIYKGSTKIFFCDDIINHRLQTLIDPLIYEKKGLSLLLFYY